MASGKKLFLMALGKKKFGYHLCRLATPWSKLTNTSYKHREITWNY
jgi:hypothetical protein